MKKIVLFDFDGVIANTRDWAYSVSHSLFGLSLEQYLSLFDGNVYESVAQSLPIDDINNHHDEFFKIFLTKFFDQPLIPGIAQSLEQLSKIYTLHIISSVVTSPAKTYIKKYNICIPVSLGIQYYIWKKSL